MKKLQKFMGLVTMTLVAGMVISAPAAAATHASEKNMKCYGVMTCTSPNMCKTQDNLMVTKATCEQLGGTTKKNMNTNSNMNNMPNTNTNTMTQPAPGSTTPTTTTTPMTNQ
jgi:hypothetical protein